eukprot:scaffold408_cov71-Cylindrotheca_fusiformis.AAC.22
MMLQDVGNVCGIVTKLCSMQLDSNPALPTGGDSSNQMQKGDAYSKKSNCVSSNYRDSSRNQSCH